MKCLFRKSKRLHFPSAFISHSRNISCQKLAAISLAKSYINLYNNYKVIYTYIKLYKILKVI